MESSGDRIRKARLGLALEQQELAVLLNVSPRAVRMWESGDRQPSLPNVRRLSKVLDLSITDLLEEAA